MSLGMNEKTTRERNRRIRLVAVLMTVPFLLVFGRIIQLGIVSDHSAAHREFMEINELASWRREVVDRNGEMLASNLDTFSLYAEPQRVWDVDRTADSVHRHLPHLSLESLKERLGSRRSYVLLERHLDPRIHKALFEEGHAGLGFERAHRRFYPQGRAAVHITGFTDIDGKGLSGAEAAFDALLNEGFHAPLEMSVDLRAQSHVHNELEAAMASNGARAAIAIVMDVETGEIISMVSLPDHDPHQPATAPAEARLNRALASRYELGSVYKALTFAAAIDHGVLDLNERLDLPEALRVGRHVIRDAHPVNAQDAASPVMQFAHSSNVASVSIALRLSSEEQGGFYQRLGLLEAAPVGYRESAAPLPPAPLSTSTRAAMSYGYSISVSPVAFLSAFNATVNGGFQVDPTFTKVDPRTGSHRTRVMSPRTSEDMRTLLRAAVEFGTATKAQVEGYAVGGKTGTALKLVNGAYNHKKVVSTFVAAFPMEQPRYSVLVLFDEPEGDGISRGRINAGFVAAPVAGRIIERIGPVLGVSPSMERRALTRLASNEAAP